MCRTKRSLLCILGITALLLSALPVRAESELIPEDQIKADIVNYQTETAAKTDLVISFRDSSSAYIPVVRTVLYEGKTAKVVETLVKANDEVAAGDPLMTVQIEVDEVTLKEKELTLQRKKEDLASSLQDYDRSLQDLRESLAEASDSYEIRKASILLQKKQTEREQYIYRQQKSICALEEEVQELLSYREVQTITAPVSGTVYSVSYYSENAAIYNGSSVVSIADLTSVLARVSSSDLPYGSGVKLSVSSKKLELTLNGDVVVTSRSIPGSVEQFSLIHIDLSEYMDAKKHLSATELQEMMKLLKNSMIVTGTRLSLPDVLTVSSGSYVKDGDRYYVYLLDESRVLHKRYIRIGLSNNDRTWVLAGINEGDTLVLNK